MGQLCFVINMLNRIPGLLSCTNRIKVRQELEILVLEKRLSIKQTTLFFWMAMIGGSVAF